MTGIPLNDDTRIDIEVQVRRQQFWIKRNLFYLSHLYADGLWIGENYDKLKKSITISILDFNLQEGEKYHSVYTLRDRDGKELTDLLEVHIIELCKELTEDSPVDGWIRLFNAEMKEELAMVKSLNRNAGIAQAAEERRTLIETWYRKGRSVAEIAELLEEDEESVREICRQFSQENP